ncbi:MAG: flagellar biosynthesis protein FlgL [Sulfuricurvum sp.]|nr:flagellar biosynthesis protein FlgL [Sulfuricurvum sp.]MDD5386457.1 flagellar biosynthesis protein FlgL [Sulfuricurvum sp.]
MRVTSTSYYNNIYGENNKLNQQLFDVNKQIASGQKIQYAHEDPGIFIDTLRLDNEITTLTQVKSSAQSAYKVSTQTDTTIGEIVKAIESMKVKLINAANSSNSDTSTQAIAKELRGLKNNLLTLANTSIGGEYLFSGTATSQIPIATDGTYQGNDKDLKAFLGSGVKQKYNISGTQLFLGDESKINRTITTNVPQLSLTEQYPDLMKDPSMARTSGTPTYISSSSTIRDLMGDTDTNTTNNGIGSSFFYIQGTKSDGTTFKKQIQLSSTDTVDTLLQNISNVYGSNQVNVSMNPNGQIEIADKKTGSSKLDFHMVGAIDFSGGVAANVSNIDALQLGTTDFETAAITMPGLYVKEFTKSGLPPSNVTNTIEGINYDRTNFENMGAKLLSNISQIDKSINAYATSSSKLVDIGSFNATTKLHLEGTQIDGITPYNINIDFTANPVAVTGTQSFTVENGLGATTNINDMTYQQLMDIVNMAVTGQDPTTFPTYSDAIAASNQFGKTSLSYDGKLTFEELSSPITKAQISLSDASSSDYSITTGSALTFNANSALTIRDPKTDFFAQIEEIIQSVEQGKKRSDGSDTTDPRNIGIQNSIQMMDDLSNHVSRLQTESGSYSQVLQASSDRSDLLIVNTKMLQSDIIDTDAAEANLRLQQLSLNYQAMLSSISKVSKLSLVNYL